MRILLVAATVAVLVPAGSSTAVARGEELVLLSAVGMRQVLLAAKSIARPDPALGGSSGVHIAQVLERLGVAEALRSRTILASNPDREHEMPGAFVASGRAEIALHQIQELSAVPGIEVVGALPGDLAGSFLFSAGILTVGATPPNASTLTVDCNTGGTIGPALGNVKPGDVLLVQGTCRENVLIPSEISGITIDGQGKATIIATDARQPAVQVLGREVTVKGFTVSGGFFGVAVNRGATATIDNNTIEGAAHSGVEVSQNSFGRIVNSTIRRNRQNGILVLGIASAHIGVLRSDDKPSPNLIQDNQNDGIQVIRASAARIIGNTVKGNRGNGLAVQQTSHADVAGNVFDANGKHGIHVTGNSGINLADSGMRLFERPNTTTTPNGLFGIRCELGAYLDGTIGSLTGKSGVKHVSDSGCIDRSSR